MEIQRDSATFNLKINGFDLLYTLRAESNESTSEFRNRVIETSKKLTIDGFEPKTFERKATYPQSTYNKPATSQSNGPTASNSVAPADLGKCRFCGADNKWSVNKGKTYCGALCFKKEKSY